MASLYRSFRRFHVRAVHCHNATAVIYGFLPGRLQGARSLVGTRHGLVPPPYSRRREWQFWASVRLTRGHVAAVCETARGNLAGSPWADTARLVTIYNGIEEPSSVPVPVEKSGFTLVTVGRMVEAKDHASLLKAVSIARDAVADLKVWLVGAGVLEPELRRLAEELGLGGIVTFFGERKDVGGFLKEADVFVLSSVSEGLPVSLLEALAASKPVIVTEVGGMPEVVRPCGCGRVVPPGNPEALAEAIVEMSAQRRLLPLMGEQGRQYWRRRFTLERMAAGYLRLYGGVQENEPSEPV
jgi:glycosyltransferase involved in cell wall biosynthesis